LGLSRNKVAVPEGAAGTPPFWRRRAREILEKLSFEGNLNKNKQEVNKNGKFSSPAS
jgi:hypothetical protein